MVLAFLASSFFDEHDFGKEFYPIGSGYSFIEVTCQVI